MRHRLSYANVMATLAVFVALGGTSYAALKITGKNVQNGSLTGADIKKHSVQLNRLLGSLPPGAKGDQGAKGDTGLKGDTGAPGPFPAELPSGKTLTGVYSVTGVATAVGQYADSPIAFGFRFSSAPTGVTVGINDTHEQAAAAGCPGTAADPQAAPGKLCVYEMGRDNTQALFGGTVAEAGGGQAHVDVYAPPTGTAQTATRFGAIVEVHSAAAGNLYSNGVWAATSP